MKTPLAILLSAAMLSACGGDSTPTTGTSNTTAEVKEAPKLALPEDAELASIYKRSCISCHVSGAANAPRTANVEDWAPRLEKGMDVLVDSAINGMGGMPALGLCMDCNAEQLEGLIRFMSGT